MVVIVTKHGVRFADPILNALQVVSEQIGPLVITSGTDGAHSGPSDPHHFGRAYDVRSHDMPNKQAVLVAVMLAFNDGPASSADGGLITEHFFGWIENAGQDDEHFHFQVRHGALIQT